MTPCQIRKGFTGLQALHNFLRPCPRRGLAVRSGDEDVSDEIFVAVWGRLVGLGQISIDFRITDPNPVENLPPAHALDKEIVADPLPKIREWNTARLERTAQIGHRGVVPPGDGRDCAVEFVARDVKTQALPDAKLQPLQDQFIQ